MLQKRPTILDFKIINNLLFYKYPKFYVGFYCICIYDTNLIESFINTLKNSFNKVKIFGIMDLSEKISFLFLKFKNRELNDILIKVQSIKSMMRNNIFRLVSKNELEKYFFFFMKQGQIEDITLSINKKERFLSLSDKNQINQQNIFKFKFKKTLLKENQKMEIISFFQTMKINGCFLFSQKNSSKFWISFVLISNSFEKFLNFINFNESLQTRLNLKLTDICKKDFIDMIIKKQLSDSTLLNNSDFFNLIRDINNETQENPYFEKLTENRKKDQDNLIKKIILILEKSKEKNKILEKVDKVLEKVEKEQ